MRVRATARGWTAVWLVVLALAQMGAFVVLWRLAVHTPLGQWLDTVALTGNQIGRAQVTGPVNKILNAMSVVSLLAATAFIGFIALIRGRVALAITATLLIGGANITTQILKYGMDRPDFGVDPERAFVGNSLPSGHTTVAASVAVALMLVLPPKVRVLGTVLAAGYAAIAGVATLSASWHRPSDAVAAYLVVGVWAALAGLVLLLTQREDAKISTEDAHRMAAILLGGAGLVAICVSAVALAWLVDLPRVAPDQLTRRPLFAGYAGSAAGIAGVMGVVAALMLAVVHRLVPRHKG
ncbi:phosphatase PAP2 family protein [Micromonospora sp. NPDC000207]|uniref:phosphatase PAP2 family protein n=1 Tax=Micromonospora sp. NPDC000207 TaxID=3154246 RepID=UPI0033205131